MRKEQGVSRGNRRRVMGKNAQVTIFVIVGILIVSGILIFFLWIKPSYIDGGGKNLNFESCVGDVVEKGIEELGMKSGFIEPEFFYNYKGEKLAYLCWTNNYYETCTVQVPFLKNVFVKELENFVKEGVQICYDDSVGRLRSEGYDVREGKVDYEILIEPGVVRVEIDAPTYVDGNSFARFNVRVNSGIYDMLMIGTSILEYETTYGDSDVDSLMIYYPDYIVRKIKQGDGTSVYILESKVFGNKFQFASKSLVWPAGYLSDKGGIYEK